MFYRLLTKNSLTEKNSLAKKENLYSGMTFSEKEFPELELCNNNDKTIIMIQIRYHDNDNDFAYINTNTLSL